MRLDHFPEAMISDIGHLMPTIDKAHDVLEIEGFQRWCKYISAVLYRLFLVGHPSLESLWTSASPKLED